MKRTNATLLTGAMAAGTFAVLAAAAPSIASADCGVPESVTQKDANGWLIPDPQNTGTGGQASIVREPAGYNLFLDGSTNYVRASYPLVTAEEYFAGKGIPLASQTDQAQYRYDYQRVEGPGTAPGAPTYQLVIDYNGTAEGGFATLVYEPHYQTAGRQGTWWSTRDLPGLPDKVNQGHGSANWGTLAEISAAQPDAVIQSFGINQPKGGQASVDSVQFGCNVFNFSYENTAPTAAFTYTVGQNGQVSFDASTSTDPDIVNGDSLTYSWNFGDGTPAASGVTTSHTYARGGDFTVTLTVSDESGDIDNATSTIRVVAAPKSTGTPLAGTGADVMGLAALGVLAVGGATTGLVVNNRRRRSNEA